MGYAIEDWPESLFSAGQLAPAGHYLRVDVPASRLVVLLGEDVLPASLDGRVAEYVRMEDVEWPQIKAAKEAGERVPEGKSSIVQGGQGSDTVDFAASQILA